AERGAGARALAGGDPGRVRCADAGRRSGGIGERFGGRAGGREPAGGDAPGLPPWAIDAGPFGAKTETRRPLHPEGVGVNSQGRKPGVVHRRAHAPPLAPPPGRPSPPPPPPAPPPPPRSRAPPP